MLFVILYTIWEIDRTPGGRPLADVRIPKGSQSLIDCFSSLLRSVIIVTDFSLSRKIIEREEAVYQ